MAPMRIFQATNRTKAAPSDSIAEVGLPTPNVNGKRKTRGFTLLEVIVVTSLLALVLAVTSLSLREPLETARYGQAVDAFAQFDALIRHWTHQHSRMGELNFTNNGKRCEFFAKGQRAKGSIRPLVLPRGISVRETVLAESTESRKVTFSAEGKSPSYGVLLASRNQESWLVFAGVTGQVTIFRDEADVRAAFEMLKK